MRSQSYTALHHSQGSGLRRKSATHLSSTLMARPEANSWWLHWALLVVIVAATTGMIVSLLDHGATPPKASDLVQQMELAAEGQAAARHLFGGALRVDRSGGQISVTAEEVPPKTCVSAAWELARKGVVMINGVAPQRVSSGKLADLCNDQDSATLTWLAGPRQ